ncbi:MICAL-like protein 1 isoform X2 [Ylistrum balloti]|nr:MICAL-like protein 1 isoform X2 [Ylistrum balloti]
MVAIRVPDRLSVVTYVSQYYNYFHDKPQLGGPGVQKTSSLKRHKTHEDSPGPQPKRMTPQKQTNDQTIEKKSSIGDKCTLCHEKVYLMERLMENNKLYHRTCFRQSDLSPTSKIYARPNSPEQQSYWQKRAKGSGKSQNLAARLNVLKESTPSAKPSVDHSQVSNKIESKDTSPKKQVLPEKHPQTIKSDTTSKSVSPNRNVISEKTAIQVSPRIPRKKPHPMDTSIASPGQNSPASPREQSPVSVGGKLKPRATPRGSIKSKDDSKSVVVPPRKKSPKATNVPSVSPPPLPASLPPSLLSKGGKQDLNHSTSLVSPPVPKNKEPSVEKHSSGMMPPPRTKSPPRLKSSSNFESPMETSASPVNFKTDRNKAVSPVNSQTPSDLKSRNTPVLLSKNEKEEPVVDTTPPKKPPRSLPRGTTPRDMEEVGRLPKQDISPATKQREEGNVLRGLLKNLANVRNKEEGVNSSEHKDKMTSDTSHADKPKLVPDGEQPKHRVMKRVVIPPYKTEAEKSTGNEIKDVKAPVRPSKQPGENQPLNEINTQDNVPAWKNRGIQLDKTNNDDDRKLGGGKDTKNIENLDVGKVDKKTKDKIDIKDRPVRPKTPEIVSKKVGRDEDSKGQWKAERSVSKWQSEGEKSVANTDSQAGTHKIAVNKTDVQKSVENNMAQPEEKSGKKPQLKNKVTIPPPETDTEKPGNFRKNLKKITVNTKFDFEETDLKESSKSPPPRPPQPSPHNIKEPRRSIKKQKPPTTPRSPGWLKDGDFRKMSPMEIQSELAHIDSKLTDLEKRGRRLEDSIRKAPEEDETMMMEWFQMVNDKNELVRKEADLIYASRTQELEDEQQDIDRQIRELLEKPDGEKTEEEKQEEELLLQKLIDVVNQRSIIVDSQDDDRIRYLEEDRDIAVMLESKGFAKKIG